jgi:hypothetical protein
MLFKKRTWLLVLFLLALVGAMAVHIVQISQTEKLYPMSVLQKGDGLKTNNLYPIQFLDYQYGYVNQAAELVVQPQFDKAS